VLCPARAFLKLCIVLAFTSAGSLRAEPPTTPKPTPQPLPCRAAVSDVLRQTFKFDPTIRKKVEAEGLIEDGVVRLEPFLVTETKVSPFLLSDVAQKREIFEANKPSFENGIGLTISPNVSVGIMPYAYDGSLLPRWKLINIRL
jgi:hypothetical protein